MIIGKIDYINLLPFDLFAKKYLNQKTYAIMKHHRGHPAQINQRFLKRQVHAGFISSIVLKDNPLLYTKLAHKKLRLGIVGYKQVDSVLVVPDKEFCEDFESNTSNALAKVLKLHGRVVIGDKALKLFHAKQEDNFIDLSLEWHKQFNLPFVFALFCHNRRDGAYENMTRAFLQRRVKVPQYILSKKSRQLDLAQNHIKNYLDKIHYQVRQKEHCSLKKFIRLCKTTI